MKNQIKIYSTHPFIAVIEKRIYHLSENQFNAVMSQMEKGQGTAIIQYNDPETKEVRRIPLNLYKITELDKSEVVQRNSWTAQGGYICKNGKMVDSSQDCQGNEAFAQKEEKGVGIYGIMKQSDRSMEARTSLISGLFCGAGRHNIKPTAQEDWADWDLDLQKIETKIKGCAKSDEEKENALEMINVYLRGKEVYATN